MRQVMAGLAEYGAAAFTGPAVLPQQAKLRREPAITIDLWSR